MTVPEPSKSRLNSTQKFAYYYLKHSYKCCTTCLLNVLDMVTRTMETILYHLESVTRSDRNCWSRDVTV